MQPHWSALSIAMLDEHGHMATIQKSILRGVGARKVSVAESAAALHEDLHFKRDIVMLNWYTRDDGFAPIIAGLRDRATSPDPFVGIILVAPVTGRRRIERAIEAGANFFLRFPFSPADVIRHVAALAEGPGAFIDAPAYFGPDRRRRASAPPGRDRRLTPPSVLAGPALAAARQSLLDARRAALALAADPAA